MKNFAAARRFGYGTNANSFINPNAVKSLDASGTSGLVIDNLSVTQLSPAASTQPFDCF